MSQPTTAVPGSVLAALPRRPALSAAVLLILGVIAHEWGAVPTGWYFAVIVVLIGVALALRRKPVISCASLGVTTFLIGALAARLQSFHFAGDEIGHFTTDERRLARLELRILDPPRNVTRMGPFRHSTSDASAGHP